MHLIDALAGGQRPIDDHVSDCVDDIVTEVGTRQGNDRLHTVHINGVRRDLQARLGGFLSLTVNIGKIQSTSLCNRDCNLLKARP